MPRDLKHIFFLWVVLGVGGCSAFKNDSGDSRIKPIRTFETWNSQVIKSTDPAGITYHPPTGHLFIVDSEINEITSIWECANVFEIDLLGTQVFNVFDSYINRGLPCPARAGREPTGITYSEYDGYFYITNDDRARVLRYSYEDGFGEAIAAAHISDADFEGIAADPSTGFLYVAVGIGSDSRVVIFDAELEFVSEFLVSDHVTDPEGIALNPDSKHLFIISAAESKIYEYTLDGVFVSEYDISGLRPEPDEPQGLTFAPSSDPNDDPNKLSLYIADGQRDNSPDEDLDRDGIIYEIEILTMEPVP